MQTSGIAPPASEPGTTPTPVRPTNPLNAPPAYPQSGTKSDFDTDGIEFLRPLSDKEDQRRGQWLEERSAYPIDEKSHPVAAPVNTPSSYVRPVSAARVNYVPPGPPSARPMQPPSQQMWAPPQHGHLDAEQGARHYQEPNLAPRRFGPALMYRQNLAEHSNGRLSRGLKIFIHVFLIIVMITMAFGAGFQSGRQVGCGASASVYADSDNATMSEISRPETHSDELDMDALDDVIGGANRMMSG